MSEGFTANFVRRFSDGPEIRVEALQTPAEAGVTVLFGASGAGKTTVLRCLAGLERPEEGTIRFGEETWFDAGRSVFVPPRKRRIGFVPQDYSLFPHMSVERNIGYGLNELPDMERRSRIRETMRWLGLDGLEMRLPLELSGGQQQRVALARAVVRRPCVLLLDEPLASLDAPTRVRLRGELSQLLRQLGIPTLLVTHDRTEALALGNRLVVMDGGKNVQCGLVHEVFSRPVSLAVAGIVAMETVQPGVVLETGELVTVAVAGRKLTALGNELPTGTREVYVCIRAEDVILVKGEVTQNSARNCLPALVRELTREGPIVRIDLDCGFPLRAMLTNQACEELGLKTNQPVLALIKAPNVHLIPRSV